MVLVVLALQKARTRQVPAFGEWNYCYHHYAEPPSAECYYAPEPEPDACSDAWFRYSPPPRKPTPKKTRRPEGEKGSGRRARASDDAAGLARAPAKARGASASRVVRPVDEDLYQVPPPEELVSSRRPRRKRRSLLMGCLGLNPCVA
uniref:Uncharacterized protein n=1 Tax=Avena sativa TaxID=4498 RepID=A0ACD5WXU9_AVESA